MPWAVSVPLPKIVVQGADYVLALKGNQPTLEQAVQRFYLTSLPPDASRFARAVRNHWGIENQLHWTLDVTFGEDQSRLRTGHGPENVAVLRHIALNLLHQQPSTKR